MADLGAQPDLTLPLIRAPRFASHRTCLGVLLGLEPGAASHTCSFHPD